MPTNYRRKENSSTSASDPTQWNAGGAIANGDGLYVPYAADLSTDLAVMAAVTADALVVENGVNCTIGTAAGTPLQLNVNNAAGSRFVYLGIGAYAYLRGTFEQVEWSPQSVASSLSLVSSAVKKLLVSAGVVTVKSTTAFDAAAVVEVTGGDLTIEDDAGGDVVPLVVVTGGTCTLRRAFTAALVGGNGRLVFDGVTYTGGTVELDGSDRASFEWLDGNLGAVTGRGGVFDYSQLRRPQTCASITETPGLVERYSVGPTQPTFTTRTQRGRGSRKERG